MGFNFILPLRITQGVFALAVLISACVLVSGENNDSVYLQDGRSSTGEAGFMVFNPIFTFIALGYLVAAPLWFPSIHNEWAVLVVEAVTWVLWLAGFAALAAVIPDYVCLSPRTILTKSCGPISAAKAATALGAFEWLAFSATLGLTIWGIVQNRRGGEADEGVSGDPQQQYNMQTPYEQPPLPPQPVMYQGPQYEAR